ncbi:MAG: MYG1 family protein [Chlamydiia bacterium]|nr:MYG1 family protein [Chlamydiia bacterium]
MTIEPRSLGTHDGTFHADEVTACALLILCDLIEKRRVIRTRDVEKLARCEFVCDVGGSYSPKEKRFDHHQVEYQGPMSSAGMVLLYLRNKKVLSQEEYHHFKSLLFDGIDAHDNGLDPQLPGTTTYSGVIANFTPVHRNATDAELDAAFFAAVDFALGHLERMLERFRYTQSCRSLVEQAMRGDGICLYFEQSIPWLESFFDLGGLQHPAQFVIMPAGSHWKLRGIPPSMADKMSVRYPLPLAWAGLNEHDLQKVSEIPGAIFCHKGRFISIWKTKEDAVLAMEKVLKKEAV